MLHPLSSSSGVSHSEGHKPGPGCRCSGLYSFFTHVCTHTHTRARVHTHTAHTDSHFSQGGCQGGGAETRTPLCPGLSWGQAPRPQAALCPSQNVPCGLFGVFLFHLGLSEVTQFLGRVFSSLKHNGS